MTQNIQLHTICPKLNLKVSLLSCLISIVVVCYRQARYVLAGLISGNGLSSNLGCGTKLGQANSGTYAIGLISWAVNCHQTV